MASTAERREERDIGSVDRHVFVTKRARALIDVFGVIMAILAFFFLYTTPSKRYTFWLFCEEFMGYGSGRLTNSVVRSAEEEEEERTSNEEPTGMNIYVYRFGHKDFMYIDGGTFLLNTIHCFEHTVYNCSL